MVSTPPLNFEITKNTTIPCENATVSLSAPVTQLVECTFDKRKVVGSNPTRPMHNRVIVSKDNVVTDKDGVVIGNIPISLVGDGGSNPSCPCY